MAYQIKYKKRGFSLVEMVIVVAIFSVFATISVTSYSGFKSRSSLNISVYDYVEALRAAQSNSQKMKGDSNWGVKILSSGVTIFKGTSYASRNLASDQTLNFPSIVNVTGLDEVVFDKITGWTSNTGTTTVVGTEATKTININAKGTITY